jgi:hypothetical protein
VPEPLSESQPRASRTRLSPEEEQRFQVWYRAWARHIGIDPDPDHPEHRYDYRGAFKAGTNPGWDGESRSFHWPSAFKDDDHPTRFKGGRDTRTGKPVPQAEPVNESDLMMRRRAQDSAGVPSTLEGEIAHDPGHDPPVPMPRPRPPGGPAIREDEMAPPVLTPSPGVPFRPVAPETPRLGERAAVLGQLVSLREYLAQRAREAVA